MAKATELAGEKIRELEGRIADLERALEEERRARREAETADRVKDQLLSLVSHELRAPLNVMLGWARVLEAQQADAEVSARAVRIIERSAQAESRLIDGMIDAAHLIGGKLRLMWQPVDLAVVVESAVDVVLPTAEAKEVALGVAIAAHPEVITGDPDRLQQVVWNLLSNAVKSAPRGGRVEVGLEGADDHAWITVRDTGKGIRPELLPYVFDPLGPDESGSALWHGGAGLGFYLARGLVELHGGAVMIESLAEPLGSTITVRLPRRGMRPPGGGGPSRD